MSELESSRALLFPGPQPPLSHLGATLLRHVVTTGLRYALHSLGAPMPERPPVRFVELRLHLDRTKLDEVLAQPKDGSLLLGALLEPGGSEETPGGAAFRGAALFHRLRLGAGLARRPKPPPEPAPDALPAALARHVQATVSAFQPALNDALLGELLAALRRRSLRGHGRPVKPGLGRQAHALVTGGDPDLTRLGVADPMVGSWRDSPGAKDHVASRLGELAGTGGAAQIDRGRGEFRESYRQALNAIRAAYLRLAADARRRGLLDEVGDAFFIPFDLAGDLAAESRPAWLTQAAANRAEYQRFLELGGDPETLVRGRRDAPRSDPGSWALAPVWPLD